MSLEELAKQQTEIGAEIERLIRNYKKDSPDRKTWSYLNDKEKEVTQHWERFQEVDYEINCKYAEQKQHPYFAKEYYANIEVGYNLFIQDVGQRRLQLKKVDSNQPDVSEFRSSASQSPIHPSIRQIKAATKALWRMLSIIPKMTETYTSCQVNLRNIERLWINVETMQQKLWVEFDKPVASGFDEEEYCDLETRVREATILLQEKINAASSSQKVTSIEPQMKLPLISIPTFDGNYLKWTQFHDLFEQMVHQQKLGNAQKMWYLKTSLSGEAERLIQHLTLFDDNYLSAWEMLNERYNNARLLVTALLNKLLAIPSTHTGSASSIKALHDTTEECLFGLKNISVSTENWDPLLLHLLIQKLDAGTHMLYEQGLKSPRDLQSLEDFLKFIEIHFQSLESMSNKNMKNSKDEKRAKKNSEPKVLATSTQGLSCILCKENHQLFGCRTFLQINPEKRLRKIQQAKHCVNCLKSGHRSSECKSRHCSKCSKKHNTLLHLETKTKQETPATSNKLQPLSLEAYASPEGNAPVSGQTIRTDKITSLSANNSSMNRSYVLLSTAIIKLTDASGNQIESRAILDSGSQLNFISQRLMKKLGLNGTRHSMSIEGIGQSKRETQKRVNVQIHSNITASKAYIEAQVLPKIVSAQPSQQINISSWSIPKNIKLADPLFYQPGPINILIGAELFYATLAIGQINLGDGLPVLQNTVFGWTVSGKTQNTDLIQRTPYCGICSEDESLDKHIEKFWQLEEAEEHTKNLTSMENRCETLFSQTTRRDDHGRFVVKLPFKSDPAKLDESSEMALRRFHSLERKLSRDRAVKELYVQFMKEYLDLGHMEEVCFTMIQEPYFFLPHHCVVKLESTTTKLRVVFDGSAKTSSNVSLNDILATGSTIQDDVFTILLRFRLPRFVFTADIEKIYRQVQVDESDRKYQLIWWRNDENSPLKCYQLRTVTYGTTPASYLATKSLHKLADEVACQYPLASHALKHDFYVDDVMSGSDNLTVAMQKQDELIAALKTAGFKLHKWCANHPHLLRNINSSQQAIELNFAHHSRDSIKTMGITWQPTNDSFAVKITLSPHTRITKRTASSDIAHIFDPLGILGPVVITAKLFLQRLWELKLDWDAALPQNLNTTWSKFREGLTSLGEINFPRHVFAHHPPKGIQLHVFADASERAYGAAAYIRALTRNNIIVVRLLSSKSKVAPLKQITLPRLELCAAKLAAQLLVRIQKDLKLQEKQTFLWTDSMIVLDWINAESSNYHTFVANRISAIQQLSIAEQWRHIKSTENPADLLSRGVPPEKLAENNLWFYGPMLLHGSESLWPKPHTKVSESILEKREKPRALCSGIASNDATNFIEIIDHRNSFRRLQRVVAYILRFANKAARHPEAETESSLSVKELHNAQTIIIRYMQQHEFSEDIKSILKCKEVAKSSDISTLSPFIDDKGVLRVGGRLEASNLSYDAKHSALLPYAHPFTKMIMNDLHRKNMHAAPQTLLAIARQTFWPIKGKHIARAVVQHCVQCSRAKPKLFTQLMGNLPADRVQPARPFVNAGVDFCGPVFTHYKTRGKRPQKAYIAVFCCFASKAVHLELVSDLSTDGFLGALRRFMGRRGHCQRIYCDNATNFVGARNQLNKLKDIFNDKISKERVTLECSIKGIEFLFIPPRAPHFGGLWEAAVKSAKHLLQHSLASASLTYEEMETVVIEVEAILNSRPITPISSDPNDLSALTPAHLLIGDTLRSSVDPRAEPLRSNLLTRWKLVQHIKNEFWKRWSNEYLNNLQHRYKWKQQCDNVKPGTMVIIKDENLPPLKWPLGRICNVIKGEDGLVRVVDVKTAHNILRRPIHRLAPLPVEEEDSSPSASSRDSTQTNKIHELRKDREDKTNNPPKRAHLTLGAAITTVLLTCLMLPAPSVSSNMISPFKTNPGIFFENIGSTNIIAREWNLIAYYDMDRFWKEFELLRNCSLILDNISAAIQNRTTYANIVKQIQYVLNELEQTNDLLKSQSPSRQKRGALNIVGNIASTMFGVLDSKYADDMSITIESIQQNEDHITKLLQNQTSILDATINIMQRDQEAINGEFERVQQHFSNISLQITSIEENLRQENLAQSFSALALQTLLAICNFQRTQNSILDVLTDTQHGKLSNLLISPRQLKAELRNIRANLPSTLKLPLNLDDILKFYNLMSLEGRATVKHIIFKLRLPLLHSEEFELFKLIPIPIKINNTSTAIRPSFPYLIVNLNRDHYYPLPESELRTCILTEAERYICKQRHPLYKLGSQVSACEMLLLNRVTPNSHCQIMTMQSGPYWVQMHNPNHWIYSLESATTINLVCSNNMTKLMLENSGILRINNDCTVKQPLITIQGHKVYPTIERMSFIPSLNLTDIVTSPNLTSALRSDYHYALHLHELEKLKHQLQETSIQLPKLVHNHNVHHYSLGYVSLALVSSIIIFLLWRFLRPRKGKSPSSASDLEASSLPHENNPETTGSGDRINDNIFNTNFND